MGFLDNAGLQYFWTKLKQKFFPLSGGTVNGDLTTTGKINAGGKVELYTNGEGGNLHLNAPDSYGRYWEMDAHNGDFRIYTQTNDGQNYKGFVIGTSGNVDISGDLAVNGAKVFINRGNFSGNMSAVNIAAGIYWCNLSEISGGPKTSGYGWLLVYPGGNLQQFVSYDSHIVYSRGRTNNQWYPWNSALPSSGGTLNGDLITHNVRPFVSANPSQTCNLGSISYRYGTFFCTGGINFSKNEISQSDNVLVIKVSNRAQVGNLTLSALMPIWASDFSTTSSRLVKENITALTEDDARKLLELTPVHFDYKDCVGGKKDQLGLIAEDVLQVIPQVVQVPDGYNESDFDEEKGLFNDLLSLDYSKLVPHLIKMAQIQQQEIDELKTRLSELEAQRITQTEEGP